MTSLRPPLFRGVFRVIALGALAFTLVAWAAYEIALWVSPPFTSSGHKVMVLGHVMVAALAGLIAAIIVNVIDIVRRR